MSKDKTKSNRQGTINNTFFVLKNTWKWERIILIYIIVQTVIGALMPLFGIYLPSIILQGAAHQITVYMMLIIVISLAVGMALFNFLTSYMSSMMETHLMNNKMHYLTEIFRKKMDTDYQNIESAQGQNHFEKAMQVLFDDRAGASGMITALGALLSAVLGFILYSGIISSLNPLVVLILVVTSLIHYFVLRLVVSYDHKSRDQWSPLDKKINYILDKISDYKYGKDIRLYSMGTWLLSTLDLLIKTRIRWSAKLTRIKYLTVLSNVVILVVRDGIAYAYLFYAILVGKIEISEFVLYFGAISGFSTFVTNIINSISDICRTGNDISDIRKFLEMPDKVTGNRVLSPSVLQDESISIEFRNVWFRYTDDGEYVLKNLSFSISNCEKIALVGENGAGKTTIVKLICGFYRPTDGEIYINGISMADLSRDCIYQLYAAVFQDLLILPMTVAQNVAMTDNHLIDNERVVSCLQKVGLDKRITDIYQPLTKMIDTNGIDLSGGEKQKLLLARALYKNAPALILDEPTSSLDPIAEAELYYKYSNIIKHKTSLFISHRLASTRFCDRIFYLENGTIIESGSHSELMETPYKYAKAFKIQSQYYK